MVEAKIVVSVIAITFISSVILYSIFMGMFAARLDYNEAGIKFDRNIRQLETSKIWENGLFILGFNQHFIKYTKLERSTVQFISARTFDGLNLSLEVSYQWKIKPSSDNLINLYLTYNGMYEQLFYDEMHSMVQVVSSEFSSFQYFEDRQSIVDEYFSNGEISLAAIGGELTKFQLLNVELPESFAEAIQLTVNAQQGIEKATFDLVSAENAAKTIVIKAAKDAEKIRAEKLGFASVVTVEKSAAAKLLGVQLNSESSAYAKFRDKLENDLSRNITSSELLSYVWLDIILGSDVNANVWLNSK